MAKLDKKATKEAIIKKASTSRDLSIDVEAFNRKINSVKDIIECCEMVRIEPIYI